MKKAQKKRKQRARLEPVQPMVAGIDVGSKEHWVCAPEDTDGKREVRVYGATTPELQNLAAWLLEQGVKSVAMESTYVYWIPLYEVLEAAGLEVVLVNASTLKNVPGRKTDMADCQWLQLLHSCALLRGSFRPAGHICRLRSLQRQRGEDPPALWTRQLARECAGRDPWSRRSNEGSGERLPQSSKPRRFDCAGSETARSDRSRWTWT